MGSVAAVRFWCFSGLLLLGFVNSYIPDRFGFDGAVESSVTHNYDRIDEVKKHCASVLSSATELKPENNRVYSIKEDLIFVNGDWSEDPGKSPIMPYVDSEYHHNLSETQTPSNLVSFWVTDADLSHRSKRSINVNGFLVMGVTVSSFGDKPNENSLHFQMWPGHTQLTISFQGVYVESKKKRGETERVMCLLGSTVLPSREADATDPWEWAKSPGANFNQPPLLQDDQILLVLRYPLTFTLTNRLIRGDLRSLNKNSNLKYFDDIHILSQLSKTTNYVFGSERFVSRACDPYPYNDGTTNSGIDIYRGVQFCEILRKITGEGVQSFDVIPNWRCNGTNDFCSKLGPFVTGAEIKATNGSFKGVQLFMQYLKCEQNPAQGNSSSAQVAAVFRAAPTIEDQYAMASRSGPSNLTISAEGIWKSSTGQLCMVGCLGLVDSEGSSCDSRICLYIPVSFSIEQRSILYGSFTSASKAKASYFPLSFQKLVRPTELWNYFTNSVPHYSYSKIKEAGVILEKNEPFSFRTVIKKSLLQFPKLEDTEAYITSLSLLAEDLTLHTSVFPDPLPSSRPARTDFEMEILSVGPLFGRYWSSFNVSSIDEETPYHSKSEYTEKQLLINVSAQITFYGDAYSIVSVLFLEGIYDPHVGKMYLVGCRDVRFSSKILFESMDLESGLDCLIEVIVSYPPTTSRWLVNPAARISISSQRSSDDPLYFGEIKLQTVPIMYRKQREDILSRRGVEGILKIATLSFAIACVLSQLFYIKHDSGSVPFVSLVMLGVQALGFSLPLITGAEALFKRVSSESYETSSYDLEKNQWMHIIDYAVKLLVMVLLLLTLRLSQKVWKSRARLLARNPNEPCRVPSDKKVFFATMGIHIIGYVFVLVIHGLKTRQKPFREGNYVDPVGNPRTLRVWETELEEYIGLTQDLFLLPQVIGNVLWQLDCKPLKELYYIGITVVRLLPHLYDYIRAPVQNPYFADEYEFVNPKTDFYSKFGDVAIPTTCVVLAAVVFVQQKWSYERLSRSLTIGQYRLLPFGSRVYQRLDSKVAESELASGVKMDNALEMENGNED